MSIFPLDSVIIDMICVVKIVGNQTNQQSLPFLRNNELVQLSISSETHNPVIEPLKSIDKGFFFLIETTKYESVDWVTFGLL